MRGTRILTVAVTVLTALVTCGRPAVDPTPTPTTTPTPTYWPDPTLSPAPPVASGLPDPGPLALPPPVDYIWALGRSADPVINGPAGADSTTHTIESVAKAWIAADWLRTQDASEATRARLARMLSYSDSALAEEFFQILGGDASTTRMITVCGLRHATVKPHFWAATRVSTADLVRLGTCLRDGRAAGPQWTPWLVATLQGTHERGAWGIVDGLAASAPIAYMNGWTAYGRTWQVNCLAFGDDWVLAVMATYAADLRLGHGQGRCEQVARAFESGGLL